MASNKVHGGRPLAYVDALAPVFANGPGSAAPSATNDFIAATGGGGSNANELRLLTFTASSEDRVYTTTQIQHDIFIPSSGNVIFYPHVHWCFIVEPTSGKTVIWEWNYVVAKPGVAFPATVTACTATGANIYNTSAAAEIRVHNITALPTISIPVADCAPSMIFVGALKLKSSSTIDALQVALLSFDLHYQCGPSGTDTEFA